MLPGALSNICAVLTRPQSKNDLLARRLSARGMQVIQAPALCIRPLPDPTDPARLPDCYDLVVFVSSNAVRYYFEGLRRSQAHGAWPAATLAAAVGGATAQVLCMQGRLPDHAVLHPQDDAAAQDSESLWPLLAQRLHMIRRALIVRGETGREWLGERLEQAGVAVDRLAVYRRTPAVWPPGQLQALDAMYTCADACIFLLTSSEGVDAVAENMRRHGLEQAWSRSRFVVIHERIAARLQLVLMASGKVEPPVIKVCQPGDEPVFQAMLQMAMCTASS